jgi:hypothetical protein
MQAKESLQSRKTLEELCQEDHSTSYSLHNLKKIKGLYAPGRSTW